MPLKKPYLTIFLSIFFTLILSLGGIWILIDDDFVKMFPDDIPSKKIWDEIQNEFGTSATIDDLGRARLTGSFPATRFSSIIQSFSQTYVICPDCSLPDTKLEEKDNSTMIHCEGCGALSKID